MAWRLLWVGAMPCGVVSVVSRREAGGVVSVMGRKDAVWRGICRG